MKQCPQCAEEVQDAAIRCKHCGADLRLKAPLAQGIVFSHVGERFLLGFPLNRAWKPMELAIWDREAPGPPRARFRYDPAGWREALDQFSALEPEHWVNPDPPACPRCGLPMGAATSGDRAASMGRGFIALGLLGAALSAGGGKFKCGACGLLIG